MIPCTDSQQLTEDQGPFLFSPRPFVVRPACVWHCWLVLSLVHSLIAYICTLRASIGPETLGQTLCRRQHGSLLSWPRFCLYHLQSAEIAPKSMLKRYIVLICSRAESNAILETSSFFFVYCSGCLYQKDLWFFQEFEKTSKLFPLLIISIVES